MQQENISIHIIGLGVAEENNQTHLSTAAQQALYNCPIVIGSKRQHQLIAHYLHPEQQALNYPSPFSKLKQLLQQHSQHQITVLASGDPLFYGIGTWISQHFQPNQYCFYPNISSIQIAFARIKQAWQTATIISLHGRALISLRPQLRNRGWYALLTDQYSQPQHIATELIQQGFGQSKLWICAALGTAEESVQAFDCQSLSQTTQKFHPLHVTLVYVQGKAHYLPSFAGIEDRHFETGHTAGKGMITKKQIRLAALNLLQTEQDDIAWDVGAGCGGMAVEWAYWHLHSQLYAIECHQARLHYLEINRQKFGVVKNLQIVTGTAPQALEPLPNPDKIFIGGSNGAMLKILAYCWQQLNITGCIVISCVTEECQYEVRQFINCINANAVQNDLEPQTVIQIEQLSLAVSHAENLANKTVMRPQLAVQLIKISKHIDSINPKTETMV
jgi:precorrin-6Y C5,15-methyltransferase (decarboxylating)